ncbi:hypothetical protein [Acinetobacter courvalinii]|uniref:hypothetical protein n=1 Tax=Acinetobacter courvalinii TaxID=280147 RepID=UPI002899AC2D|nr:hypothetical protein [Acinetobacter courvalinii]
MGLLPTGFDLKANGDTDPPGAGNAVADPKPIPLAKTARLLANIRLIRMALSQFNNPTTGLKYVVYFCDISSSYNLYASY